MRLREFLSIKLGNKISKETVLPSGFHLVGHVALLTLNSSVMAYEEQIGNAILEFDNRVKSVAVRTGPTYGVERNPSYRVIAGTCNTITTLIENGIKFRVDPIQLTFSGGNKRERIEFPKRVKPGEKVVDMFSCVGQFALHIAGKQDTIVIAIEINPIAYNYLVENIHLNGFEKRVLPILGDCRKVHPVHYANRVIMGYLHETITYLPYALDTLMEDGGTIHMHMGVPKKLVVANVNRIHEICKNHDFDSKVEVRKIKNYSPGIDHFVFDIEVMTE